MSGIPLPLKTLFPSFKISDTSSAIDALDIMVPGLDVAAMEPDDITQSALNKRISEQNMTNWRSEALSPERVHLQAYSSFGCGHEISLVPSKTLDTHLSPSEFVNTVSRRLESWTAAGRAATVVNIWMRRGHTAYLAWLVGMLRRSTTRFGTSTSISAIVLG